MDFLRINGTASRASSPEGPGWRARPRDARIRPATARDRRRAAGAVRRRGQPGRPAALLQLDPRRARHRHRLRPRRLRVVSDLSRIVLAEASARFDVDHDAFGALDLAADLGRAAGRGRHRPRPGARDGHGSPARSTRSARPAQLDRPARLGRRRRRSGLEQQLGGDRVRRQRRATWARWRRSRSAPGAAPASPPTSKGSGVGAGSWSTAALPRRARHRRRDRPRGRRPAGSAVPLRQPGLPRDRRLDRGLLALVSASRGRELTVQEMIAEALAGDAGCRRAITDAGRVVGGAVAGLVNLFSPRWSSSGRPRGAGEDCCSSRWGGGHA